MNDVHYSSKSDEWETPPEIYADLHKEFAFTLDPASTNQNAVCPKFFTYADDGLSQDWFHDIVFLNPPYGRSIKHWIKKAYEESLKGATVVCLIPSRTDTKWWHDYCMQGTIRFIKGRLKFINRLLPSYNDNGNFKRSPAPFPSAIVIFYPRQARIASYECPKSLIP